MHADDFRPQQRKRREVHVDPVPPHDNVRIRVRVSARQDQQQRQPPQLTALTALFNLRAELEYFIAKGLVYYSFIHLKPVIDKTLERRGEKMGGKTPNLIKSFGLRVAPSPV